MNYDADNPKFPHISVNLVGVNGNAFSIIGTVTNALRRNKVSQEDVAAFEEEAMSSDYNHLLTTCMKTVDCSGADDFME